MDLSQNVIISRYGKQNKDNCVVQTTTFIKLTLRMFVIPVYVREY